MERRTQSRLFQRDYIRFKPNMHWRVKMAAGESNATKDLCVPRRRALAAATIAGSPHIIIATEGTNPSHPVLGVAWTWDAGRQRSTPGSAKPASGSQSECVKWQARS